MKTNKITLMAMLIALALILSYLESQIPSFVAIPGVKVGLANIIVVFALYRLGSREAMMLSAVRVFAVSLLFGSGVSFLYSLAGALLSLLGMILMKKLKLFSCVAVSVTGGVLHNVGQIGMACLLLETNVIIYYLPFLILSGTIAGVVIGLISAALVRRFEGKIKY